MADRTDSELLDLDVAILIVGAPVYITGFCVLIAWGFFNDWRARRAQSG